MYSTYATAAAVSSSVFAALAIVAVGFRLRARSVQKLRLGLDDWLVLVALVRIAGSFDNTSYRPNHFCGLIGTCLLILLPCSLWIIQRRYWAGSQVCADV